VLRAARLVDAEKKGLYVEYRLADDEVCRFFLALRGLADARLAEVEQVTREYFERAARWSPSAGRRALAAREAR
jgi:DNA-binding transcriptional ArsR family regulator